MQVPCMARSVPYYMRGTWICQEMGAEAAAIGKKWRLLHSYYIDFSKNALLTKKEKPRNCCGFKVFFGGDKRDRTADLLNAIQALSQLSYTPILCCRIAVDLLSIA